MAEIASPSTWLDEAARVVLAGGVVALPFERLFGLAARAAFPEAVARSAAVKTRDPKQPISAIVHDLGAAAEIALPLPPLALELAARYWPGPLTLLVPARPGLSAPLVGPRGLVGVRVPGSSPALELVRRVGCALTATSANRAGGRDALSHGDLLDLEGIDLVVPGSVPGPPGSTIVDASGDAPIVVRQGILEID
ncbi:MAG: L-threonylcarbamoyladenylate synthase [Proteobacteria bacterium]|nr:L-threonylcarbamoyladenylate synthase [Pseudomonadota bacterium]